MPAPSSRTPVSHSNRYNPIEPPRVGERDSYSEERELEAAAQLAAPPEASPPPEPAANEAPPVGAAVDTSLNRQKILNEFKKVLRDENVRQALRTMFPIATEDYEIFETILYGFLGKPAAETDVPMDTLSIDDEDEYEKKIVTSNPDKTTNKRHASAFKAYVSGLFKKGSIEGVNVYEFFSDNLELFRAIRGAELEYSEKMAEVERELIVEDLQQVNIEPAPQSVWVDLELGGLKLSPIKVDAETAKYLSTETINTIKHHYSRVFQTLTGIITRIGYITIKLGSFTFNVSAHTLLWLITFFYDLIRGKLAEVFDGRINTLLEYIYERKEKILGSPFMNIMDPTVEESKIRRLNRIVNIFLYTMIDLLIGVKNEGIPLDFDKVESELEGFQVFIKSDINTWSLQDIYKYGSFLFNKIMAQDISLMSSADRSKLSEYLRIWYNISIKKVASFVDYRIFSAKLGKYTLNSVISPLAIVMTAPPMHKRTREQVAAVERAEHELRILKIQIPVPVPVPGQAQAPEPEPQFSAQSKKKRTRRRRRSKGNSSTKGKKKKGKKRKKTKRGRKKK